MANKFSVLVPVFNEEARIKPLIKQILKQDLPKNYKLSSILVIASGCTDKTVPIVKKLSKKFEKVQLKVRKERKGKVSAINHGLDLIETETVIMLSGDLLIEKPPLKIFLKNLKEKLGQLQAIQHLIIMRKVLYQDLNNLCGLCTIIFQK